jgi:hypothetical protein
LYSPIKEFSATPFSLEAAIRCAAGLVSQRPEPHNPPVGVDGEPEVGHGSHLRRGIGELGNWSRVRVEQGRAEGRRGEEVSVNLCFLTSVCSLYVCVAWAYGVYILNVRV